jgi:hypothetical protein
MAVLTPIYRGRLYAPKSVDPNDATLLVPRAGALHTDPFRIATKRGVPGYPPYIARHIAAAGVPSGLEQGRACPGHPGAERNTSPAL